MYTKILQLVSDMFYDLFAACGALLFSLVAIGLLIMLCVIALFLLPLILIYSAGCNVYDKYIKSDND